MEARFDRLLTASRSRASALSVASRERRRGSDHFNSKLRSSERGIALIAVLWVTVLVTVIASSFAYSMRSEALAARNTMSLAQARAAADGAIDRTAFELSRPHTTPEAWNPDGSSHSWTDGDIVITVSAIDEASRIDLNTAPDALIKGLLQNVGGVDADTAQHLLEAILDWRDADDLKRPNGAEAADYTAAGLKYGPSNAPFETVGELRRVMGMTTELMNKIAGAITVYSKQQGINITTAPRDVLRALPGATPEQVDEFIAARKDALASGLPLPPFPASNGYANPPSPVWRIHAEARMPDGVTFARDAVLRQLGDPRRPFLILAWQVGGLSPKPEPSTTGPDALQKNGTGKL